MFLALIAATSLEVKACTRYLKTRFLKQENGIYTYRGLDVGICITGVGLVNTAISYHSFLQQYKTDIAVQAGIAGCFHKETEPGSLYKVEVDYYGDLGVEDNDRFIDVFELGFENAQARPFRNKGLYCESPLFQQIKLPSARAISVNKASGSNNTIIERLQHWQADIESMEGASFHQLSLLNNIDFAQIRSVSNFIEPRNKNNWQLQAAIDNLNIWLVDFIKSLV